MSALPHAPPHPVPDASTGSLKAGIWFVFDDDGREIALRVGPSAGRERTYLDGSLLFDRWVKRRASRHRFTVEGTRYALRFVRDRPRTGRCCCSLRRDGALLSRQYAAAYTERRWLAQVTVPVLLALAFLPALLGLSAWWLLPLPVAYVTLLMANRANVRFTVREDHRPPWSPGAERLGALRRMGAWRRGLLRTARNLHAGWLLLRGWQVRPADVRARGAQVFTLAALASLPMLGVELIETEAPRALNPWGVTRLSTDWLVFFASVFGLSMALGIQRRLLWLTVALLGALFWVELLFSFVYLVISSGSATAYYLFYGAFFTLFAVITLRALRAVCERPVRRLIAPLAVYMTVIVGAFHALPHDTIWYTDYFADDAAGYTPPPRLDTEGIYYRQPRLVRQALDGVRDQDPGETDVYFVGFASYASQDVFKKEVAFVRDTAERHFAERGRSITLVNHADTADSLPMANVSNLGEVLRALGGIMDVDDDVLFLYLTSHGSRDGVLSVDFPLVNPNQLDAPALRRLLDESGIRWRIVVVSACFSGTFIEALADPHTLVLTAAHEDRTSFGCSNERELTYFAEHLFEHELDGSRTLLDAFDRAHDTLEARETREGYAPSLPQRRMGEAMARKLGALEAGLGREAVATGE